MLVWVGDVCYCFVRGAGLRVAQGSGQEVAFEPYSEGFLLLSDLPQANGSTMRACSGAVPGKTGKGTRKAVKKAAAKAARKAEKARRSHS